MAQSTPPYSWRSDWNDDAKQPGLEVRQTWANVHQPVDEAWPLPEEDKKPRRICGFTPAVFWLVLLVVVLIVGGAVGGGIGGWIATHPSDNKPDPPPSPGPSATSKPHPKTTDQALSSCSSSYDGQFNLRIINATSTTDRDEGLTICSYNKEEPCVKTLTSGVLVNHDGPINYINHNDLFSLAYDPSDYDTKFTKFSVCSNGSLAVGGTALFYYCYTESWDGRGFFIEPKSDRCYPSYLTVSAI